MRAIVVFSVDIWQLSVIRMGLSLSGEQFTNKKSSVQPKIPRDFCPLLNVNLEDFLKWRNTFPSLDLIEYQIQDTFNTFINTTRVHA